MQKEQICKETSTYLYAEREIPKQRSSLLPEETSCDVTHRLLRENRLAKNNKYKLCFLILKIQC